MQTTTSRSRLSRRNFLKVLAAAGATAIAGSALSFYAPWLDYGQAARHTGESFATASDGPARMRELVRYATLAANGHNTQPWKFALKENAIEIHPDYARSLPVVDPDHRELWISLGCALENLAGRRPGLGYAPEVTYPETVGLHPGSPGVRRAARWGPIRRHSVASKHPLRIRRSAGQNSRPRPGAGAAAGTGRGPALHHHLPARWRTTLDYVSQGNLSQYADTAFLDELIAWLRFNKKEALATLDGLYSICSGNPEVPRWLGQMFVAGTSRSSRQTPDAKKLRSSPGAVLVCFRSGRQVHLGAHRARCTSDWRCR